MAMSTMNEHEEKTRHGPGRREHAQPGERDEYGDAGGPIGEVDPEEIVAHEDRAAELQAQVEEWKAKYQRSLADFQNYQRRAVENEREARRQGVTSVVSNLLAVLDNFDLALKNDPAKVSPEQIVQGVTMIRQQMLQALGAIDVRPIEPEPGAEFDPHRHEAVVQVQAEGIEPGRIAATFQAGYTLGERVLRPAKVSVSKGPIA